MTPASDVGTVPVNIGTVLELDGAACPVTGRRRDGQPWCWSCTMAPHCPAGAIARES
jgi:hypothetical protein